MTARGLDHLVIGVRDLDAAGRLFERMGFTVGGRNQHSWGTDNRIVQMPGFFIELITVARPQLIPDHAPRRFSFGRHVADALARGEGPSMVVLESRDAAADAAGYAAAGIGDFEPFTFSRKGRTATGEEVEVSFSLAFAQDELAPDCGFFACRQHRPELFWSPKAQTHANGVNAVDAVYLVADNPTDHHIFLSSFTGQRALTASSAGIVAPLPRGRIEILTSRAASSHFGRPDMAVPAPAIIGLSVRTSDLVAVERRLASEHIAFARIGARIVVPASQACGCILAFEAG
jgi:Glyoxalase-like domain